VYQILRASTRRLLKFVESEIARRGGGCATIYNDMLEMIGSRRNPAIIGMAKACGGNIARTYRHDATPWCALTVNYCLIAFLACRAKTVTGHS
jgi:hypothetical protein